MFDLFISQKSFKFLFGLLDITSAYGCISLKPGNASKLLYAKYIATSEPLLIASLIKFLYFSKSSELVEFVIFSSYL